MLPGISGLWQVSGRNQLTFEEMIKLDLYYIENWSLELDLRILFKTKIFNTVEQLTRYSPVPAGMDYRRAIQMLRGGAGGAAQTGR